MRNRAVYLFLAALGAVTVISVPQEAEEKPTDGARHLGVAHDALARLPDTLPVRAGLGKPLGILFDTHPAAAQVPPAPTRRIDPPSMPPVPYRFVGHLIRPGSVQYLLAKGDNVFPVTHEELLEGTYRVKALSLDEVTLLYVPLGIVVQLARGSAPAPVERSAALAYTPAPSPVSNVSQPISGVGSGPAVSTPAAQGGQAVASETNDAPRTAATGTRAAHLRRQRAQQLPPMGALAP